MFVVGNYYDVTIDLIPRIDLVECKCMGINSDNNVTFISFKTFIEGKETYINVNTRHIILFVPYPNRVDNDKSISS